MTNVKELYEYIEAYFPWKSKEEIREYLIFSTPWPIVKNQDTIKAYIRTQVLEHWDGYVKEGDKNGFTIAEKPDAKILHPANKLAMDLMAVPTYYKSMKEIKSKVKGSSG